MNRLSIVSLRYISCEGSEHSVFKNLDGELSFLTVNIKNLNKDSFLFQELMLLYKVIKIQYGFVKQKQMANYY